MDPCCSNGHTWSAIRVSLKTQSKHFKLFLKLYRRENWTPGFFNFFSVRLALVSSWYPPIHPRGEGFIQGFAERCMWKVGDSKPGLIKRGLLTRSMCIINPLSSAAPQQCSVASCLHSVRYTAERRRNAGLTKDRQHGCRQVTWPLSFFLEDGSRTVHNCFLHLLFLSIILLSPLWRVLPSLTQRLPPGLPTAPSLWGAEPRLWWGDHWRIYKESGVCATSGGRAGPPHIPSTVFVRKKGPRGRVCTGRVFRCLQTLKTLLTTASIAAPVSPPGHYRAGYFFFPFFSFSFFSSFHFLSFFFFIFCFVLFVLLF